MRWRVLVAENLNLESPYTSDKLPFLDKAEFPSNFFDATRAVQERVKILSPLINAIQVLWSDQVEHQRTEENTLWRSRSHAGQRNFATKCPNKNFIGHTE